MAFDALDIAHQVITQLRAPLALIARADGDLARQIRRAATSVPLNLSEGRQRAGKDRTHLWRVAAGSAAEASEALHVAVSWGYVDATAAAAALATLDRLRAVLWRLTH
jgi:four helix bundle protein